MSRRRIQSDSEEEIEQYSSSSFKRTKFIQDTQAESSNSNIVHNIVPLATDNDGFVEGSIVRMVLTNFVTYDYCEIYPGPQMNMIIGPNGTGKSTIVCAIALGLGGSPNLLGRAKNIAEFVKTGQDEASILIELKQVNKRNTVIQRFLKKSNNSTSWKLNGKPSSQKDVMAIVNSFNIQVDNLCQFLPQDRVAEFAELTPSQLLERTQAAAGKTDLHDMQKQLIDWRNQQKQLNSTHESDIDHLKTLKNKNAELEKDIARMESRQRLENQIRLLKTQLPLVKYTESKARTDGLIVQYNTEKENVRMAKQEVAPIDQLLKQAEKDKLDATKAKITEEKNHANNMIQVKKIASKLGEIRVNIDSKKKEIKSYQEKLPERKRHIENQEKKIEFYQNEIDNPPSGDVSTLESAIESVNLEIREIHIKKSDLEQKIKEESKNKYRLQKELDDKRKEKEELQNVTKLRYNKLQRDQPDTIKAYEWIKQHRTSFKGQVYNPVVLLMNIKDPKYAALVENALGGAKSKIFRSIIFEKQEDYMKFTAFAIDKMKWRITAQWPGELSDDLLKTPISKEELQSRYKLESFVIDLIDAPKFVLKTLCLENGINMYPVSLQRVREQALVESGKFGKFAIGQTAYNVKVSAYGNRSKQTTTTTIRQAEFLNDSIDTAAQESIEQDIRMKQANIQQTDVILKEYTIEDHKLKQTLEEYKHKKEDLQAQKRDIQLKLQRYNSLQDKLKRAQADLIALKERPKQDLEAIEGLKTTIQQLLVDENRILEKYMTTLNIVVNSYEQRLLANIEYHHLEEKFSTMRTFAKNHTSELREAEKRLELSKNEYKLAERETKKYMEDCKTAGNDLPEHLVDDFRAIVNRWKEGNLQISLADLEIQINEKQGELDAIRFANPHAMQHYEERKEKIKRLDAKVEDNKIKLENLIQKIAELKSKWEPLVKQLVAQINVKFTAAFSRIHCVGEVHVDEHEDFDKWGINIYVKFRDNEKLQLLTGQRQSGGERSVSTILYLMSLQDLARSPFRVVDEINQGMDPRNERMIHEQIVEGASRPGTSQYFLITPKLLPDLHYNERMRVLCIYNSEWLPTKIKPLSEYLENYRQTQVS